jgi:hypothetical protein
VPLLFEEARASAQLPRAGAFFAASNRCQGEVQSLSGRKHDCVRLVYWSEIFAPGLLSLPVKASPLPMLRFPWKSAKARSPNLRNGRRAFARNARSATNIRRNRHVEVASVGGLFRCSLEQVRQLRHVRGDAPGLIPSIL